MKKHLISWVLTILLFVTFTPLLISAQGDGPLVCCQIKKAVTVDGVTYNANSILVSPGEVPNCELTGGAMVQNKKWTLICLISSIKVVTDWIFNILMVFVSLMFIFGAYTITTAGGSPEKVNKGKNYLIYAVIGLVIGLLSNGIPDLVEVLIGT
jgi:hypothetical protein